MNKLIKLTTVAALTLTTFFATATMASAHVGIQEGDQEAGAYTVLTFGVPHGCDGAPTNKIEIQIPESILNVTPTRNALYDLEVVVEDLAEPITGSHGEEITSRDAVVIYTTDNPLPDGERDTFELSLQIPADAAGTTLYFPTVQTCTEGSTGWIEIPEEGQDHSELESPAPSVNVVEGSGDAHGHGETTDDGATTEVSDEADADHADADHADTEEAAAADIDGATVDAQPVAASDDGTDPIAIIALIVGALGLAFGVGGFVAGRRKA